jgi:NAD+ kinase
MDSGPKERHMLERCVIGLYVDVSRDYARAKALEVATLARDGGFSVFLHPSQVSALGFAGDPVELEEVALLVTVGGDGTLLRAAHLAAPYQVPLFGINAGRLGFLTEVDVATDLRELVAILENGFFDERRVALQARIGEASFMALNDVVVRKKNASRVVPFTLELDHEDAARIPCDGIVVATPTGSTAYFLSAGGPLIAPNVDAFGIVPLLPHTLFSRPIIVHAESTIAISLHRTGSPAHVEIDGEAVGELEPGTRLLIRRYDHPVRFARTAPVNFFTRLEKKFNWGKSIIETSR